VDCEEVIDRRRPRAGRGLAFAQQTRYYAAARQQPRRQLDQLRAENAGIGRMFALEANRTRRDGGNDVNDPGCVKTPRLV
jgi:hypothetical protein